MQKKTKQLNKGKGSNNRRSKNYRPSRKDEIQEQESGKGAPIINDSHIYFTNPILAEQLSNFSFNQFLGGDDSIFDDERNGFIPTFMRMYMNPSPGWLEGNVAEGINAVALKTYTKLSASNAKTTNYAPQDVSTLILAVGQVIAMIEFLKRALGVVYTYNTRNRSFPLGLLHAMGINGELINHVADSRAHLNAVINQFNSIPIPENITYLKDRCKHMYAHIFADSESPMAQYYVHVPYSTWIVDEQSYDQGTILRTLGVINMVDYTHVRTFDNIIDEVLQPMVTALLSSSTLNYIYSDILRLAGSVPMFNMELVSTDYVIVPEYNPMMLLQIHNTRSVSIPDKQTTLSETYTPYNDVYPDVNNNSLVYKPKFIGGESPTQFNTHDVIINFPHSMGNPDVDQRIDVTRYQSIMNEDGHITLGDYYCAQLLMVCTDGSDVKWWQMIPYWNQVTPSDSDEISEVKNLLWLFSRLSQFEHCPLCYLAQTPGSYYAQAVFADLDFFTTIDYRYLQRVNDMAMMGEFELRS